MIDAATDAVITIARFYLFCFICLGQSCDFHVLIGFALYPTVMKSYVVFKGHRPGVYDSWAGCNDQISGHPGNLYQSFNDENEAKQAFARYLKHQKQAEAVDDAIEEAMRTDDKKENKEGLTMKDYVIVALVALVLVQLAIILSN